MSAPPQLGTHMWPNASVTTNGRGPTLIVPRIRFVVPSISETVLLPRLGIQTVPSGAIAPSTGRDPTLTEAVTVFVAGSILWAVPPETLATQTTSPLAASHAGVATPTSTGVTSPVAGSILKIAVPWFDPTQIEPAANASPAGAPPVLIFAVTRFVAGLILSTVPFELIDVQTFFPSNATSNGLTPTRIRRTLRVRGSTRSTLFVPYPFSHRLPAPATIPQG